MTKITNFRNNRASPTQSGFTVTNAAWVKIVDQKALKGVDLEYLSIQVKGTDPTVEVLLTADTTAPDIACKDISQGIIFENELLYFQCDWYVKVKGTGEDTNIAVWTSNPNVFLT